MNPNVALLLIAGLVTLSLLLGGVLRLTRTRVRRITPSGAAGAGGTGRPDPETGSRSPDPSRVAPGDLAAPGGPEPRFGDALTVVQFSTETCARCPATARVLSEAVAVRPGAVHLEIDVTRRDDLIARFSIMRTPTLLVVDDRRRLRARVSGPLGAAQAGALLDEVLPIPPDLERSPT